MTSKCFLLVKDFGDDSQFQISRVFHCILGIVEGNMIQLFIKVISFMSTHSTGYFLGWPIKVVVS